MVSATKPMTLDEFLAMPETEPPSEFICGEVVQKPMPTGSHSLIASELSHLFRSHLAGAKTPGVFVESRHALRPENRAYLPDVAFVLAEHMPGRNALDRGALDVQPDIAIEILSPEDRPSRVAEKVTFYMRNNTPLVWVIDPIDETLDAYRPGLASTHHTRGDIITGEPVLPDFRLDVGALFAVLGSAEA